MRLGLAALVLCAACAGDSTVKTQAGGGSGSTGGGSSSGTGGGGGNGSTGGGSGSTGGGSNMSGCSDEAKTVYVVDADGTFSAFDPRTKTFRDIGTLNCPAPSGAHPFSMSVARDASAYVLFDNGELFKVATSNLACTKTAFAPNATFRRFGMGFSTDTSGGTTDTLFIAGGQAIGAVSKLGRLDLTGFSTISLGDITGWPELSGTGDAQLWGFFPETAVGGGMPFVARFDKTNGNVMTSYPATMLAGSAEAWAFAFWGGSFWVFLQRDTDASTQVWEMKANNGAVSNALSSTNRRIVGAGVSTCAPITIN